jgi:hypothetical protein
VTFGAKKSSDEKKTEERKMFEIKKPPNRTAGIRWLFENLFSEI